MGLETLHQVRDRYAVDLGESKERAQFRIQFSALDPLVVRQAKVGVSRNCHLRETSSAPEIFATLGKTATDFRIEFLHVDGCRKNATAGIRPHGCVPVGCVLASVIFVDEDVDPLLNGPFRYVKAGVLPQVGRGGMGGVNKGWKQGNGEGPAFGWRGLWRG
jgi:hypothetical protein